jgi:hypothetical protein
MQSSSGTYKIFLDLGGVHSFSNDFDLTTEYGLYNQIFSTDPNGAAWTWANINNLRLGVLVSSPSITGAIGNLTLRPNAVGSSTVLLPFLEANNYDCVNEEITNEDTNYVYKTYNAPNHTTETGVINSVTIYDRVRAYVDTGYAASALLKHNIRVGGSNYEGTLIDFTGILNYTTYSNQWVVSPNTLIAWTWAEIDSMEIGHNIYSIYTTNPRSTQLYAVVNYTNPSFSPQIRTTQAYIKVNYTSEASCCFLRQPETYTLSHERNIKISNTWSEHIVRDDGRNSKNLTLNGCEYESQATARLNCVRNMVEEGIDCTFYGLFDGNLNTNWHIKSFNYDRDAQNPNVWNYTMNCECA